MWRRSGAIAVACATFGIQALLEILEINGPSWIPVAFAFYALGSWAHGATRLKAVCVLFAAVSVFLALGLAGGSR